AEDAPLDLGVIFPQFVEEFSRVMKRHLQGGRSLSTHPAASGSRVFKCSMTWPASRFVSPLGCLGWPNSRTIRASSSSCDSLARFARVCRYLTCLGVAASVLAPFDREGEEESCWGSVF